MQESTRVSYGISGIRVDGIEHQPANFRPNHEDV